MKFLQTYLAQKMGDFAKMAALCAAVATIACVNTSKPHLAGARDFGWSTLNKNAKNRSLENLYEK
jgi:hypothetical protein